MLNRDQTSTLTVVSDDGGSKERGQRIQERRLRLAMDVAPLARRAHVDRDTLKRMEEGDPKVRDTTFRAVERALDDLESEMGMDDADRPGGPRVVRFVVRGVYGAEALIVEGPVEDIAELEASVDRIMRRLRQNTDEA